MGIEIVSLISNSGKYEIIDSIDEGMNAYAFKAKNIHLDRVVFLKIYDAHEDMNELFREPRLLLEATKSSDCLYLVCVLDTEFLSEDYVLMAMEHVDGGSLLQLINTNCLPLMQAINITKGILHGVSHLHANNLLHRDLKPANIMAQSNRGFITPRISDFGSVTKIKNCNDMVSASKHSALYVPPEGWESPSQYGVCSDVYQVGLIMNELINGALPYEPVAYIDNIAKKEIKSFEVEKFTDMHPCDQNKIINGTIQRYAENGKITKLTKRMPYINRTLVGIINKATNPDYSKRFPSALEMLTAISQCNYPNWFNPAENDYIAYNWLHHDWHVIKTKKNIIIKKCKAGTNSYRKCSETDTLEDAFKIVLEWKK